MRNTRIHPYIPSTLRKSVTKEAEHHKVSESEIVTKALQEFLNPDNEEKREQVIIRRLDRQSREIKYLKRDIELLTETLSMYIKVYLSSTPEVPEEHKPAAGRSGQLRYKKLVEAVANRLSQGKLFIDELPKDTFLTEEDFIKAGEKNEPVEKVDTISENV